MHYVYLMPSAANPIRRYVGYGRDLRQRLTDRNEGKNPGTSPHRPWRLRAYVAFATKERALDFERYLKSGSGHAVAKRCLR